MQEKKRVRLKANVTDECNREYRFSIEFFVFQQDGAYIAYCPSMDISTSGKTFNEAVGNFHEMFQLHIECCIDNESLIQDTTNNISNSYKPYTRVHHSKQHKESWYDNKTIPRTS